MPSSVAPHWLHGDRFCFNFNHIDTWAVLGVLKPRRETYTMATQGNMDPPVQPGIQPLKCSVCGSVWFRSATFIAPDPQTRLQAPLAVCLCGAAVTPSLSGTRPPAEQEEIDRLLQALKNIRSLLEEIGNGISGVSAAASLPRRVAGLERSCQLMLKRLLPASTAMARSRPPRRRAATRGRDKIVLELQRGGLKFRQARQVITVVIDLWKEALLRGESVETPAGDLVIRTTPSGRRRIVLVPSPDLLFE